MNAIHRVNRHKAREAALQMLYQWEVGRMSAHEAVRTYWPGRDAPPSPDDEHADAAPEAAVDDNNRIACAIKGGRRVTFIGSVATYRAALAARRSSRPYRHRAET